MNVEHRFAQIPQDARRGRAWVASYAPLTEIRLDPGTTVPINAFHRYHHLGEAVLAAYETPAQTMDRPERLVTAQGLDHLILRSHTSGRARITVDGRVETVGPGDIVFVDLAQPVRFEVDPVAGVDLVLPRRVVTSASDGIAVRHGRILLANGHPLTRLVADHLRNLAACLSEPPVDLAILGPATIALCRGLLAATSEPGEAQALDFPVLAMRRFIDQNLATVDVPMLAARFGHSRARLYKRFAGQGGIASLIRDRRLAAAMRTLNKVRDGRRPMLARLANECGFADTRVFSRAFHRKYGLWPAEVSPIRDVGGLLASEVAPMTWLRDL